MSGDFRLQDAAAYEKYYGQTHPHPELPRRLRLRPSRAEPRADPPRPLRRLARLLRHHHRARAPAAGPRRAPRGRGPRPGHHRQLRLGRGPAGHHPPPGPRREPARLQAPLAPARPGGRGDAGRGRGARPPAALRAGLGAAGARHPRHLLPGAPRGVDRGAALASLYRDAFAGEPFVRVPARRLPEVAAVSGSNFAEVGVAAGPAWRGRRTVTVVSAIDNLVKGGAGQAIQNMNLVLGLDERGLARGPRPVAPVRTIMTIHPKSMLAAGARRARWPAPALAQGPAPPRATPEDRPAADRGAPHRAAAAREGDLVRPAHAPTRPGHALLRGGAGLDLRGPRRLRHRQGRGRRRWPASSRCPRRGRAPPRRSRAGCRSSRCPTWSGRGGRGEEGRWPRAGGAGQPGRGAGRYAPWPTRGARSSSSSPRRAAIRSTPTHRRRAGSGPSSGPTT